MADAATRIKILKLVLEDSGIVWPLMRAPCVEVPDRFDPASMAKVVLLCTECTRGALLLEPFEFPAPRRDYKMSLVTLTRRTWSDGDPVPRSWDVWIGMCPKCKTIWWRIQDPT